ncbi:MAG: DUF58 domain-containing protein [Chloroflexi bacterium]|nr:DUF58 domain-containing protein [Chloroflexota bacterium]
MKQFSTLILIMLIVAFLLRVDFIFYVIYLCIGVYAWSRWSTPRALQNLVSSRRYNSHAFWGESIPITIRLQNSGRIPLPWIRISESVAVHLKQGSQVNELFSLGYKKSTQFTYHITARKRGYYQLGPMHLTTGDLFGIVPPVSAVLPAEYITIYPRIIPLTKLGLPSRLPFGTIGSRQRLFADPARPMGIRHFRSGDSIRQINWKASAHTRQLVVKTYEPAISLETAILLDLHADSYQRQNRSNVVEWAIEVTASLAAHLVDRRQAVGLITNGIDPMNIGAGPEFDEISGRLLRHTSAHIQENPLAYLPPHIPPRNGRVHLIKILERLARIESDHTLPLSAWAAAAVSHLSWGVTILVITPHGSEEVCQTLHHLVRTGFNPVLITVEPDANFGLVRQRAHRLGFTAYNISNLYDLDSWRRPLQTI